MIDYILSIIKLTIGDPRFYFLIFILYVLSILYSEVKENGLAYVLVGFGELALGIIKFFLGIAFIVTPFFLLLFLLLKVSWFQQHQTSTFLLSFAITYLIVIFFEDKLIKIFTVNISELGIETTEKDNPIIEKENSNITSLTIPSITRTGVVLSQENQIVCQQINIYIDKLDPNITNTITVNTYQWMILDLCKRTFYGAKNNPKHELTYKDFNINCHENKCYCHSFVDTNETRETVRTLFDYLETKGQTASQNISIQTDIFDELNNRILEFFDQSFDYYSKPELVFALIRVVGRVQ